MTVHSRTRSLSNNLLIPLKSVGPIFLLLCWKFGYDMNRLGVVLQAAVLLCCVCVGQIPSHLTRARNSCSFEFSKSGSKQEGKGEGEERQEVANNTNEREREKGEGEVWREGMKNCPLNKNGEERREKRVSTFCSSQTYYSLPLLSLSPAQKLSNTNQNTRKLSTDAPKPTLEKEEMTSLSLICNLSLKLEIMTRKLLLKWRH